MLMSDENREVLQTLLCFLSDVTSSVEENQMTPMNIAVCLAPSLFHLNLLKKDNLSPPPPPNIPVVLHPARAETDTSQVSFILLSAPSLPLIPALFVSDPEVCSVCISY